MLLRTIATGVFGVLLVGISACVGASTTTPENPSFARVSAQSFNAHMARHQGERIDVRGFLMLWNSTIFLVPNRAYLDDWSGSSRPAMAIALWDSSIEHELSSRNVAQHPCLYAMVEVSGRYVQNSGIFKSAIYEINEIRAWPDDQFSGDGILCFHQHQDGLDRTLIGPGLLFPEKEHQALFEAERLRLEEEPKILGNNLIERVMPGDYKKPNPVSVSDLAVSEMRAPAAHLSVRGYLKRTQAVQFHQTTHDLFLVASQSSTPDKDKIGLDKISAIRILDNSLTDRLIFDFEPHNAVGFQSKGWPNCRGNFAEVTGGFIKATVGYPYVFYDVHEIRVFEDETFKGEGTVCYRKDEDAVEFFPLVPGLY